MYKLIDCRLVTLDSFATEHGFQPTDAMFYVVGGSFLLCIGEQTEIITENDLVILPAGMEFERHMIAPVTLYHIRFEDSVELPRGRVKVANHTRLLATLAYLTELTSRPDGRREYKDYYLGDIFMQIKTERSMEKKQNDSVVAGAIQYFEANLNKKITLADTAAAVGVSVSALIQHFNDHTDLTPARYLTAMRIKKAEMLLCTGDMSLTAIASQCGYANTFNFSGAFKKYKGISPKVYRQKYGL